MNKRIVAMVRELSQTGEMTIADLADKFSVSQRTIRNDLNSINDMLNEHELEQMQLKSGGRIIREDDFSSLISYIDDVDFYQYKLSKQERVHIAAAFIVNSSSYITLSTIADNLFVSRATIISDLDAIKAFIRKGSLEVISHANKGLRIEGKESDKRLFLMHLGNDKGNGAEQDIVKKQITVQGGNRIVIQKIITEQEHTHKSFLTDGSFQRISTYLGIMVGRNMQGEYMEVRNHTNGSKYMMAQDILKYISQYCHINTTEDEVSFLAELLQNSRYLKQKTYKKNSVKIQLITRQYIAAVSEELGINLNGDYDFFENLSNHLESVFTEKPPVYQENSLIDEVLENNPDVLGIVTRKLPIITHHMKREITQPEIGYIAIHICAAIERKKNKEVAFHVIVACHAGIGTSQLLLEKLKKHFNFQIVDVISSHEALEIEKEQADFIISTVPLQGCKLDYVIVSPLLSDEDYLRVGNKIDALRNSRNLPSRVGESEMSAKGLLEQLSPIVYDIAPEQAYDLMRAIKKTVRDYFNQPIEAEAEIFAPYLHHLLMPGHIQLDVECEDWEDAVRKSAQKLLQSGYIEERYVDAMIENIKENGPYVVMSKGFAVPHEGLEQGSIKVGMNLIRLKHPVPFGEEELDPVEFVCCLSAVDKKTHLKAFFNLVNMLQNNEFKEKLRECETPEEANAIIEKYEYSVMNI